MNSPKTGACFSLGNFFYRWNFYFRENHACVGHIMIHVEDIYFHIGLNGNSKQTGIGYKDKTIDTTRHIIQTFIKKNISITIAGRAEA